MSDFPYLKCVRPARLATLGWFIALVCLATRSPAQVDQEITKQVWMQKFGVLPAQWNEQPPYANWLDQDADGDGVKNRDEFTAGTNPFRKRPADPHFRAPVVTPGPGTLAMAFPTVPGKSYGAESSATLAEVWSKGALPVLTGDGSVRTLVVPMTAGPFFRLSVSDQASQGDLVSDWAKYALGLSMAAPLASQTSYDHTSLAVTLLEQNVVTLSAPDPSGKQPPDAATPTSDYAVVRVTRSGQLALGTATVPLAIGGTGVEGVDFAALPTSVTFPPGVKSLDVKIKPLSNPSRTTGTTVFLTALAPGSAAALGNYSLGSPATAGVTLYPSGFAGGTGLAAAYFPGSSATYSSPLNFGDQVATTYAFTRDSGSLTSGTAVVTYFGLPAPAFVAGGQVTLQFTSGSLNTSAFNTLKSYTILSPVTANTFSVAITGTGLPGTTSGNSVIAGFSPPVLRLSPFIDANWGYGTPNGNNYISADNFSVTWDGFLAPTTAGNYTFRLDADDKARVLIDLGDGAGFQQILQNGWDTAATGTYKSSAPVTLVIPPAPANRYPIRLEFVETTGAAKCKFQWQLNSGNFVTIPSANVFTNNVTTTTGWVGNYYNNPTFTAPPARTQTDADPTAGNSGDWLTGSPDPLVFHNNFSSRWTGQILPQYSQTYYFAVKANDGFKLWVNNQLLLDKWTGFSGTEQTASIDLVADVLYDIKLEHYELTGSSEIHLSWFSEDQAKQVIPTNRLFPTNIGPPAVTSPTHPVVVLGLDPSFSLPLTSSNGGALTASGLPPWLTLVNGILIGTPPAAGLYQFQVTATNASGSGSAIVSLEVVAPGSLLTRERWTSAVTGPGLADVPWTSAPDLADTVPLAEDAATTYGPNTGERLRGYFVAPVTGNYYFWIAANNAAELWISNNGEPVNKVRRAIVTGPAGTGARTWNSQPGQKSQWLSLVAGQKYYFEALHNTGADPAANHLSVAWFRDPTGTSPNPIATGSPPSSGTVGGLIASQVLGPWDNPPTTTIPGTLYVTNLQGVQGAGNITATGGAFLRVNGTSAILQLDYSGLSSGAVSKRIQNAAGNVVFDLDAQDRNYPALRTTDGGYSLTLQASDLLNLANGQLSISIATVNHPDGELSGTFGKITGSQTAPATPASPSWPDRHTTSDADNSRFLSQATFGPGPVNMAEVKAAGYRTWIDGQIGLAPTHQVPYILANLSADPQNPYPNTLFFNSWWKNSVTAPDQLRQRAAFALSEILVVSDTGPLNNNGRTLADYYDTLLDHCFGNFRDLLKQVTLSSAMGVYLDMRGNAKGDIATGIHPNENYAREILQLFSAGLYRVWPDGTLVLDSKGGAVPTYDQNVVTGMARVFTGWTWGQAMAGGRLPTNFSPASNYLDPMVLVPTKHELGTKMLLDNVVLPAATIVSQSDSSTDPASTFYVQSTDPVLGPGTTVNTRITNQYDLNGVRDLEVTLDNILANSATGPYICRQLIQRLVTSHPKPEYVARVVRAFNGERNVDGVATGVRGAMADVFRAILLDAEARDPAAVDSKYGKQREPLLRVTGPARAFPPASFAGSSYSQSGAGTILVTTPVAHRLINGESVRLADFTDGGGSSSQEPTSQTYVVGNAAATSFTIANNGSSNLRYTLSGSTAIIDPTGVVKDDKIYVKFTDGGLAGGSYDGVYTLGDPSGTKFTIAVSPPPVVTTGGSCLVPKFTSGYNVTGNSGSQTLSIQTSGNHNLVAGDEVQLKFIITNSPAAAVNGVYPVLSVQGPNSFKVAPPVGTTITNGSQGSSSVTVYPLKGSQWLRNGTVTVEPSTWGIGPTPSNLNQTPLNAATVFNFFYPDYRYPGELAKAGMTTPEFQLTNDSNTMNLTNTITQGTLSNNFGNPNGYVSFFGANAIMMDLAPYMTPAQTTNAAIPGLVDTLGTLLCGGNLTTAALISKYVADTTNFPLTSPTPTSTQMRDRVRAIFHLIVTSPDYAIQK